MTLVWACYTYKQLAGKIFKYHVCYVQLNTIDDLRNQFSFLYIVNFIECDPIFWIITLWFSDPFAPFLKLITYYTLNVSFLCVLKAFAIHTCTSNFYCSSLLFWFFVVFRNKLTAQSELLTSWYTCMWIIISYLCLFEWH